MKKLFAIAILVLVLVLVLQLISLACEETYCSPGYWKNHTEVWWDELPEGVDPVDILGDLQAKGPGSNLLRDGAATYLNSFGFEDADCDE